MRKFQRELHIIAIEVHNILTTCRYNVSDCRRQFSTQVDVAKYGQTRHTANVTYSIFASLEWPVFLSIPVIFITHVIPQVSYILLSGRIPYMP